MSDTYLESELTPRDVEARPGASALEFGAPWCGICAAAKPALDAAFDTHPGIDRTKVWDGPGKPLGRSFKIKLWPTLVLLKDGQEVERLVRPSDEKAISAALERLVAG